MTGSPQRAEDLRMAFDAAFAEPARQGADTCEDLLAIRLGGSPYAIRIREVAGIAVHKRIAPVPSPTPEMMGLAAIRGLLVAVYDLGALLEARSPRPDGRWLVLCGNRDRLALAFDDMEGYRRVARSDIVLADPARLQVREVVRGPTVRAVASIPAILERIHERIGSSPAQEG